jgi:hypothetical protein
VIVTRFLAAKFREELAWNVMKDYFEYQGTFQIIGSRKLDHPELLAHIQRVGVIFFSR